MTVCGVRVTNQRNCRIAGEITQGSTRSLWCRSNPVNRPPIRSESPSSHAQPLNLRQVCVSAVPTTRKPFDVLIEGLYSEQSRGGGI